MERIDGSQLKRTNNDYQRDGGSSSGSSVSWNGRDISERQQEAGAIPRPGENVVKCDESIEEHESEYLLREESCDDTKYVGLFLRDRLTGDGQIIFEDDQVYYGQIENGEPHGRGILYYPNNSIALATFSFGEILDGETVQTFRDGRVTRTEYVGGYETKVTVAYDNEVVLEKRYYTEVELLDLSIKIDDMVLLCSVDADGKIIGDFSLYLNEEKIFCGPKPAAIRKNLCASDAENLNLVWTTLLEHTDALAADDDSEEVGLFDSMEFKGNKYLGAILDYNSHNGVGQITFANGDVYYGPFESGEPVGFGFTFHSNGSISCGERSELSLPYEEHIEELPQQGTLFYTREGSVLNEPDGKNEIWKEYSGEVLNGVPHGTGTMKYLTNGHSYSGEFSNGAYNGIGVLEWSDGCYCGKFSEGKFHGYGELLLRGDSFEGTFSDGHFVGQVELLKLDGKVFVLTYNESGQPVAKVEATEATKTHQVRKEKWPQMDFEAYAKNWSRKSPSHRFRKGGQF